MKLNSKGRYAVMAMADLAATVRMKEAEALEPVGLAGIAQRQEISQTYLEQLFAKLRRAGLVTAARGPGGGYLLARAPEQIRISDIIQAVDEQIKATRCSDLNGCLAAGHTRCLTHDLWEELGRQIYIFLHSVTLADVVSQNVLGRSQLFGPDHAPTVPLAPEAAGS